MPFRETPEEWAKRTGIELSPEELDLQAIMDRIPDALRYRAVLSATEMVSGTQQLLDSLREQGYELDFIGNWWVEGNPYKGLNCVFIMPDERLKFEVQVHTEESARVADDNHSDYEIYRLATAPLADRQTAFTRMVARAAGLAHPPGVETIGTLVTAERPTASPSPEPAVDPADVLAEMAEQYGFTLIAEQPEYPEGLQALLDKGRAAFENGMFRSAIATFDELAAAFQSDPAVWTQRGVATALTHSGQALMQLERYAEAIERFDRVIAMAASDFEVELEGVRAANLKQEALAQQRGPDS